MTDWTNALFSLARVTDAHLIYFFFVSSPRRGFKFKWGFIFKSLLDYPDRNLHIDCHSCGGRGLHCCCCFFRCVNLHVSLGLKQGPRLSRIKSGHFVQRFAVLNFVVLL